MKRLTKNSSMFISQLLVGFALSALACENSGAHGTPVEVLQTKLTIHVYDDGRRTESHKWHSTRTIQNVLDSSRHRNNKTTIHFSPGEYVINEQINVIDQNYIEIVGSPGTVFSFPPKDLSNNPKLTKEVEAGDETIYVDSAAFFKANHRYQVYKADRKGDRILEFHVKQIRGKALILSRPAVKMKHVRSIPVGSPIYEQHNFFVIRRSQNIKITNIIMDGGDLGEIKGHTIYSGILVLNGRKDVQSNRKASFSGLEINKCIFKNLKGRGIAVYNMENIFIEANLFANIGVEAIEIDHFSSAIVQNNTVKKAAFGISCNDCYNTIIQDNYLEENTTGIIFRTTFGDSWVNKKNIVQKNYLINSVRNEFTFGRYAQDNAVSNNTIQNSENKIRTSGNYAQNALYNNKVERKVDP